MPNECYLYSRVPKPSVIIPDRTNYFDTFYLYIALCYIRGAYRKRTRARAQTTVRLYSVARASRRIRYNIIQSRSGGQQYRHNNYSRTHARTLYHTCTRIINFSSRRHDDDNNITITDCCPIPTESVRDP